LADFHKEFQIESEKAYILAKNKWYKIIKNNNLEILKLLNIVFDAIYLIVSIEDKVYLPEKDIENAKT